MEYISYRNIKILPVMLMNVCLFAAGVVLLAPRVQATADTLVVTNTNDSGVGSLRQAMLDANDNDTDMDTIEFNIPGSGPHIIKPQTNLPPVSEKITINGFSQPGSQPNTAVSPNPINSVIKIEIDGSDLGSTTGILVGGTASESIIRGLSIHSFKGPQVQINAVSDVKINGNFIGLKNDGQTAGSEQGNVIVTNATCEGLIIGGSNVGDRNVIGSTDSPSVLLNIEGDNPEIYGNYIGVAKDGFTRRGTQLSIGLGNGRLSGPDPVYQNAIVGGAEIGKKNLISGGAGAQISSLTGGHTIQGNYIGTDYLGNYRAGLSTGPGIALNITSSLNLIGGTQAGEGNIIAGVAGAGVGISEVYITVLQGAAAPVKNTILGNSIYKIGAFNYPNFGDSDLGIELITSIDNSDPLDLIPDAFANQGPTPNDPQDADTGPNGYINYPVLKTAQQTGNQLTITYDLDTADSPTDRYRVEFYANNERSIFGHGPGETYLGAATSVEPGTNKTATITVNGDFTGKALSATTTAIDNTTDSGFGSTSEFAQNISIGSAQDFDADGIPDAVEDAAPNNGDGNNDGIPDKDQPTVSSFKDYDDSNYITLITDGCSENGTVSSLNASSLQARDTGYTYPHGLTDFTLYCSRGNTVNITMYVHGDTTNPEQYIPRKYNPTTKQFTDIPGSNVSTETLGASTATKLTYSVKDGSDLDDDGEENGIIVDPMGLATEQNGVLANTGDLMIIFLIPTGLILILGALYTYRDYRKHKKPLVQADPFAASTYTYWHHLKVVAIPMAKYRLSVTVERKQELKPNTSI